MRKLAVSQFVTLDGVMGEPMWTGPYQSEEQIAFKFAELQAADALLLGRVTYEGFAATWPQMAEQTGEYGVMMNGYPKYVASTTLETAEWNNSTIIRDNVVEAVIALKQQPGKDIVVFGSGRLIETLLRHDLIDEYRLLVFPVVLGDGQRLFPDGLATNLQLAEAQSFSSGVVALTYRPAPQEAPPA
jgi:dihydrofolate reductase